MDPHRLRGRQRPVSVLLLGGVVEDIAEIVLTLAGGAIAGRLLRSTLGRLLARALGRAGALMLRAVTGIATRWAIRETLTDLLQAIADTKIVKAVRATFDETAGKKLESALATDRQHLIDELAKNGVKFTPENIVAIARDSSGRIIFLETGTSKAGLAHIIGEHGSEFAAKGIPEAQIPEFVMRAVTEGTQVGLQGRPPGRPIYQLIFNDKVYKVAVTVGINGFVVGANLR